MKFIVLMDNEVWCMVDWYNRMNSPSSGQWFHINDVFVPF